MRLKTLFGVKFEHGYSLMFVTILGYLTIPCRRLKYFKTNSVHSTDNDFVVYTWLGFIQRFEFLLRNIISFENLYLNM